MNAVLHLSLAVSFSLAQSACDHMPFMDEDPVSHTEASGEELREELVVDPTNAITPETRDKKRATASANIQSVPGKNIEGHVRLVQGDGFVELKADVSGLAPGKHGFHIHEKGDCSNISGGSMGAHFDPKYDPHRLPREGKERHLGDLGNLEVNRNGRTDTVVRIDGATLEEDHDTSILGRAVVIHSGSDRGQTEQPSGASGTPVACAVIERS